VPWAKENEIGTRLMQLFNVGKHNEAWYEGSIQEYDKANKKYHVHFLDGERGIETEAELNRDAALGILVILERAV